MSALAPVKHRIGDHGPGGPATWLRRWESLLVALLLLVFLVGGATQKNFLDPYNLADSTFNFSEKALIALPMALLILVREIDISVAAMLALSSVAMGFANQHGVPPAGLAATGVAVGAACGALNGLLVTRLAIPAIVVTIGTMSLYRGIALVVLGDQAYTGYPEALGDWGQGYFFGFLPRPFVVLLLFAALFALALHATSFGRRLVAIGSNPVAARFSGIAVERHRFVLFVLTGAMSGLAAVLLTGRIGSFFLSLVLTLFGWLPGVIHAFFVVSDYKNEQRLQKIAHDLKQ